MNRPRSKAVVIGFGSVARILWGRMHACGGDDGMPWTVIEPNPATANHARALGLDVIEDEVTRENYQHMLTPLVKTGSIVINLGVDVSSVDLMELCHKAGALYLDAGIELWGDRFSHGEAPTVAQSRSELLRARPKGTSGPTALIGHGANPGLASHWAKAGLLSLGREYGLAEAEPDRQSDWGKLAEKLGVRVIQIAEHDHGVFEPRVGCFCNTWSVRGLAREALQLGELGWGSHEGGAPKGSRKESSPGAVSVALPVQGCQSWVRSWTPLGGVGAALAVTHLEALGLSAYLSRPATGYAPTCYYAYQACEPAKAGLERLARGDWSMGDAEWVAGGEDIEGIDELGALLMGERFGSLWIGSRQNSAAARSIAPGASATTLQVAAGLMSAWAWMERNPARGVMEPEELPSLDILAGTRPWIGPDYEVRSPWIEPLGKLAPIAPESLAFDHFWLGPKSH